MDSWKEWDARVSHFEEYLADAERRREELLTYRRTSDACTGPLQPLPSDPAASAYWQLSAADTHAQFLKTLILASNLLQEYFMVGAGLSELRRDLTVLSLQIKKSGRSRTEIETRNTVLSALLEKWRAVVST